MEFGSLKPVVLEKVSGNYKLRVSVLKFMDLLCDMVPDSFYVFGESTIELLFNLVLVFLILYVVRKILAGVLYILSRSNRIDHKINLRYSLLAFNCSENTWR